MSNEKFLPFADVVAIDAWHTTFDGNGRATVHVDASFNIGRVGGASESEVRFELGLKRAEVVVVLGREPLTVDPASVARDEDATIVKRKVSKDREASDTFSKDAELGFDTAAKKAAAKGGMKSSRSSAKNVKSSLEVSQEGRLITSLQSRNSEGDYRWTLWPRDGDALRGKPWQAAKEPRLDLILRGGNFRARLDPTVIIEVRCLYEDIHIDNIAFKDVTFLDRLKGKTGQAARDAAAKAFIRHKIFGAGSRAPIDPYTTMTFARVRCTDE